MANKKVSIRDQPYVHAGFGTLSNTRGIRNMAPSAYYLRWQSHMLPGQNTRRCTDWTLANLSAKLMYLRDVRVLLNMLLQTVILCKLSSILGGICRSVHVL